MFDMTTYNLFEQNSMRECVRHILEDVESGVHMNDERKFNLRLVLNELIINGFEHGGATANSPLVIAYQLSSQGDVIELTVDDGGGGYDYSIIKSEEHNLTERGRGLMLVKALCEKIDYNQDGSRIMVELAV